MPLTQIDLDQAVHTPGSGSFVSDQELISASGFLNNKFRPIVSDVYSTSSQVLTTSWVNLAFTNARIFDPEYIAVPPTGIIVSIGGVYKVLSSVTTEKTSGNQRSSSAMSIALNGTIIPGTIRAMYNRNIDNGFSSATSHAIINLSPGSQITIQIIAINSAGTIATSASSCSWIMERIR